MSSPQPSGGQVASGSFAGGAVPTMPVAPLIQSDDEGLKDGELDQEWVNKAKDVIAKTKTDPFTQSNEIHKIRADYLKARFGKELDVGSKPLL